MTMNICCKLSSTAPRRLCLAAANIFLALKTKPTSNNTHMPIN